MDRSARKERGLQDDSVKLNRLGDKDLRRG